MGNPFLRDRLMCKAACLATLMIALHGAAGRAADNSTESSDRYMCTHSDGTYTGPGRCQVALLLGGLGLPDLQCLELRRRVQDPAVL